MTSLHNLYWESQELHDKCFMLERKLSRFKTRGKAYLKTLAQWCELLFELKTIESEMALLEAYA